MKTIDVLKSITEKLAVMSPRKLVLVALAISIIVAGIVYIVLNGFLTTKNQTETVIQQQTVVMAAADIPERTRITKEMLKLVDVPNGMVPSGAVHTMDEAVGKVTSQKIRKGDIVTAPALASGNRFTGMIPDGMRAITIPINDVTGVAGLAKPGDYVDIFMISSKAYKNAIYGKLVLQKVLLLAVNQSFGSNETDDVKKAAGKQTPLTERTGMITIAVFPSDVLRVQGILAEGTLYLALRPDTGDVDVVVPDYFQYLAGGQDITPAQTPAVVQPNSQNAAPYYPMPSTAHTPAAPATSPPSGSTAYSPSGGGIEVIRGNSVSQVYVK